MYNKQHPPPGQYPPPQGQYPHQGYPPQGQNPPPGYPPQRYPSQSSQSNSPYQGQGGQYPPPSNSPHPAQYPPRQGSSPYSPQGGQYPPPNAQYPPPPSGYGGPAELPGGPPSPQGHRYPSQGGYPPYGTQPPIPPSAYRIPPPGPPQGSYPPYGAPPQTAGYGAPPPGPPYGQYGAPPPQQYGTHQYGLPPGGGGGPPTAPSPGYGPPLMIAWDATPDAKALRSAMKGFGTDENTLIRVLANKDPHQIEAIKAAYSRQFSRSLEQDVKSETSGYFGDGLVSIIRGPLLHDVHLLHTAVDGPGTKEKILNDVLLGRSNADIQAIKDTYRRIFNKSLESDIKGDLSMKTERHFMIVLDGNRAEDSAPVIPQAIDQEVMEIYKATEGKLGTDEMLVCSILSTRNDNQIRTIRHVYAQKFKRPLEDVIKREFSGHMKEALLYQLQHATDKYMHAATLLEDTMSGLGTKDQLLVARVVRYHWDRLTLENVKGAYRQRYHKSLTSRIRGETSGDYRTLMAACVGE
ncbi:hypothetical protein GGR50DRAFT_335693 [Xylaria sp. CBS 124048]|nr:hypothetical protein GGR50DRAFT_335693 [Xylaria sp. CBS 124048]